MPYVVRVAINHFWDSWTSTSWKAKSSFAGVILRDTLIDVREWQEQSNSVTKGRSRMTITQGSALTDEAAVPLYLSRVGRAGMGIAGPVYSPDETK